ncbi:hypothetical protein [Peribacillus frigoritolerans]|uniref:hypothetical protein n=1 Tax=Peribacillus frigoritolerans TaxID=450367 RepID=UPI00315CCFA3
MATLIWKSLLIQATKTEQAFSEEKLKKLAYFLILSLVQTFVSHLHDDNHHTFPKTASSLFNIAKLFIKDHPIQPLKTY